MPDRDPLLMSQIEISFSYDGPAMATHRMDVYELAPALLAFGDLLREANYTVNGENASVTVFVRADFEKQCFLVNYEVVHTFLQQALGFVMSVHAAGAKEIVEWTISAWELLKLLKGKKVDPATTLEDRNNKGDIIIPIEGDNNNVTVNKNVFNIYENPQFRRSTEKVLRPLERPGIELAEITVDGKVNRYDKKEAADIVASCRTFELTEEIEAQPVVAWLTVYSPKYDTEARTWQFKWGEQKITVDVSKTDIVKDALSRGAAYVGDRHKVEMAITQEKSGRVTYKVNRVLESKRGPQQVPLPSSNDLSDE